MEEFITILQILLFVIGIICVLISLYFYGKRTSDWRGVLMVFFKRVEMTVKEFRYYKWGVFSLAIAVVLRIISLTLWG